MLAHHGGEKLVYEETNIKGNIKTNVKILKDCKKNLKKAKDVLGRNDISSQVRNRTNMEYELGNLSYIRQTNQLAMYCLTNGQKREASQLLKGVLSLCATANDKPETASLHVMSLNNRASGLRTKKKYKRGLGYIDRAMSIINQTGVDEEENMIALLLSCALKADAGHREEALAESKTTISYGKKAIESVKQKLSLMKDSELFRVRVHHLHVLLAYAYYNASVVNAHLSNIDDTKYYLKRAINELPKNAKIDSRIPFCACRKYLDKDPVDKNSRSIRWIEQEMEQFRSCISLELHNVFGSWDEVYPKLGHSRPVPKLSLPLPESSLSPRKSSRAKIGDLEEESKESMHHLSPRMSLHSIGESLSVIRMDDSKTLHSNNHHHQQPRDAFGSTNLLNLEVLLPDSPQSGMLTPVKHLPPLSGGTTPGALDGSMTPVDEVTPSGRRLRSARMSGDFDMDVKMMRKHSSRLLLEPLENGPTGLSKGLHSRGKSDSACLVSATNELRMHMTAQEENNEKRQPHTVDIRAQSFIVHPTRNVRTLPLTCSDFVPKSGEQQTVSQEMPDEHGPPSSGGKYMRKSSRRLMDMLEIANNQHVVEDSHPAEPENVVNSTITEETGVAYEHDDSDADSEFSHISVEDESDYEDGEPLVHSVAGIREDSGPDSLGVAVAPKSTESCIYTQVSDANHHASTWFVTPDIGTRERRNTLKCDTGRSMDTEYERMQGEHDSQSDMRGLLSDFEEDEDDQAFELMKDDDADSCSAFSFSSGESSN